MVFIKKMEKVVIISSLFFCVIALLGIFIDDKRYRWIIFALFFLVKAITQQYFSYLSGQYIKIYYKELINYYDKKYFPFANTEATGIYLNKEMLMKYGLREGVHRYNLIHRINIFVFFISTLPIIILFTAF